MRHMRMEQRPKWSVTAVFVHVATGCVLQWSALVSKEYGHLMNPPRKQRGKGFSNTLVIYLFIMTCDVSNFGSCYM